MPQSKKRLVKRKTKKKSDKIEELNNVELVYIVRSRGRVRKVKANGAFNELLGRLNSRIKQISLQFYIPGLDQHDIYQEALSALRYKAIPDYDNKKRGKGDNPFDKFAVLCIRRHLSTVLKQSWQVKRRALNMSISLDQDRNKNSGEQLFLSDIIAVSEGTVLSDLEDKEYYKRLFSNLYEKLSKFEKIVFRLYIQRYSYEEMAEIINKSSKGKAEIKVKSIDNALSRIKQKGILIFKKYGEGKLRKQK